MRTRALFHKLGELAGGEAYLEKYSRSLLWLAQEPSARLAGDCDTEVEVDTRTLDYLRVGRCQDVSPPGVRVGRRPFPRGVELTLVVTTGCNFGCGYCFGRDVYRDTGALESAGIATAVKQFLLLCEGPVSSFILFGGEPLLAFPAIRAAWPVVTELFRSHQQKMPSLALVTNGSLMDVDIAAFLAEHDFAVTVSLDGPRMIHDLCRPFHGGGPSYDAVVAGIEKLRRAGVYYAIEATYTSQHLVNEVSVTDIVDHSVGLGARETHIMPAFPERASGFKVAQHETVVGLFGRAAQRAARHYLESHSLELYYVANVIHAFAHNRPRRYICTAGIDKFTVTVNGDVVPCYLVCDGGHRLATTRSESPEESPPRRLEGARRTYEVLSRDHLDGCAACWAADWCFACYGPGYLARGRLGAPGGLDCKVYRRMVEAALLECADFLWHRNPGQSLFASVA